MTRRITIQLDVMVKQRLFLFGLPVKQNPGRAEAFDDGYMCFKLGAQLKSARVQAGMTQNKHALKLGTARSTISRIENHADNITLSTLRRYAKSLGKKVHFEIV